MNEMMIQVQATVEQGWLVRVITAVGHKLYNWFSHCHTGLSYPEVQLFVFHGGFGWQDAQMYSHMVRRKNEDMI